MSQTSSSAIVEIWKPNRLRSDSNNTAPKSRNSNTPCGFLVNNTQCQNPECDYSHERWRVNKWKGRDGTKACLKGKGCPHLPAGNCLYYHPVEHFQTEFNRETAIMQDLEFLDRLPLGPLMVDQPVTIRDKGDLASFNKLSDDQIAVPGCPPRFHPLTEPVTVKLDWHNPTLQPGFAKYTHTFEPLLRSLEASDPSFDLFSTADVVSNASNLRKLFQLFTKSNLHAKFTERFELEWRHNTLFLSKWNEDPSLLSSLGHGTGFEKVTCRYADDDGEMLKNSSSHHRVVWYNFAGLECVVQSEVDGYYCDCDHPTMVLPVQQQAVKTPAKPLRNAATAPKPIPPSSKNYARHRGHWRTSLSSSTVSTTSSFSSSSAILSYYSRSPPKPSHSHQKSSHSFALLSLDDPGDTPSFLASSAAPHETTTTPTLKIHHLPGRNIPSPCLIEIKTHKAIFKKLMIAPEAQLYFCRRTKLFVAQHRAGVFEPVQINSKIAMETGEGHDGDEDGMEQENGYGNGGVEDKTEDLAKWESENQRGLGKVAMFLRMLIGRMREMAREKSGGDVAVRDVTVVVESFMKSSSRLMVVKANLYRRGNDGKGVRGLVPGDI